MSGKTFVKRRGTTAIPNATVHDDRLSFQALGLLLVVLGRPARASGNGYRAFMGRGMGQAAILRAFQELEAAGYRYQFKRRQGGKLVTDTIWSETPLEQQAAAAWHAKQTSDGDAPTVHGKSRTVKAWNSTHGTVQGSPRTETHAPLLRKDQGSLTPFGRKEPVEPNARDAEQLLPECRICGRGRENLYGGGVCSDCIEPQPAAPHPQPPHEGWAAAIKADIRRKREERERQSTGTDPGGHVIPLRDLKPASDDRK